MHKTLIKINKIFNLKVYVRTRHCIYYILHINENIKSSQRIQQINVCAKTFHREDIITI